MNNTLIIVPCYNEGGRLRVNEFRSFLKCNSQISFVFINDGSTDNTNELIEIIRKSNPDKVEGLTFMKNRGKAEAVRIGVLRAIDAGARNIGYWDADLSTPLEFIDRMIDKLNEDIIIVLGSRVKMLGYRIERNPVRHYLGRVFATCASWVLGLAIYDTQCGAKVFRNNSDLKKVFSTPFTVKWTFDVEILARYGAILKNNGAGSLEDHALEYPLKEWTHIAGSKVKPSDFLLGINELFKIYRTYK